MNPFLYFSQGNQNSFTCYLCQWKFSDFQISHGRQLNDTRISQNTLVTAFTMSYSPSRWVLHKQIPLNFLQEQSNLMYLLNNCSTLEMWRHFCVRLSVANACFHKAVSISCFIGRVTLSHCNWSHGWMFLCGVVKDSTRLPLLYRVTYPNDLWKNPKQTKCNLNNV